MLHLHTRIAKVGVPDQRWWTLVENVHAQQGHLYVPIDDPIEFEILVIISEWVDQLFAEL